ncbi:hypothetical protein [Nocardia amamiensis]|uniref:hypothetical protein n=1 Tax=Nocardia amamiensis TaxID=404578 RepID=UPI0033DE4B23
MTPSEHHRPERKVIDDIDALVTERLDAGPDVGASEMCPHCPQEWHALPITKNLLLLRLLYCGCDDCATALASYDYHSDDSPVLCPGSNTTGPLEPFQQRAARHGVLMIEGPPQHQVRPELPPPPPDGCALRFPFPAAEHYRARVFAYRLSRPWRDTEYVVVMHTDRYPANSDDEPSVLETVLFRYFPPGAPRPPIRETFIMGEHVMSVPDDDSDANGYSAAIDNYGVTIELDDTLEPRHRADGHVAPDPFVQLITGQMVVGTAE